MLIAPQMIRKIIPDTSHLFYDAKGSHISDAIERGPLLCTSTILATGYQIYNRTCIKAVNSGCVGGELTPYCTFHMNTLIFYSTFDVEGRNKFCPSVAEPEAPRRVRGGDATT